MNSNVFYLGVLYNFASRSSGMAYLKSFLGLKIVVDLPDKSVEATLTADVGLPFLTPLYGLKLFF